MKTSRNLALVALMALFLVGCAESGGTDDSGGERSGASSSSASSSSIASSGETSGGSPGEPEQVEVDGGDALVWGDGGYGVVHAHGAAYDAASWSEQAPEIANYDTIVLALENTSTRSVATAAKYLQDERGVSGVALIGASAGSAGVLGAGAQNPELADQIILLSGSGDVAELGEMPKLFVASEGEGLADTARRMSEEAAGDENETLILPGDAHAQAIFETNQSDELLSAIRERIESYR